MARISKMTKALSPYRNFAAAVAIAMMTVFLVVQQSAAGPITGGMGNPPYSKLSVYQGVLSIVPGGIHDSVMEIGNGGRDIASTGRIYLRPGSVTTPGGDIQGGDVLITPQDATHEGGELILSGAASFSHWWLDVVDTRFRIYDNTGLERLAIATDGNVYVPSGKLCFGNAGDISNCINAASIATPTLDNVLARGNSSTRSAALGAAVSPLSKLVLNNGTSSTGNANDALSTYANTVGSAIYAQQNNAAGYAGYFSGRVNITGDVVYKGRLKPTPGIQVCQVGTDNCLGRYVYTSGTGPTAQYCYERPSVPTFPITCVNIFVSFTSQSCAGSTIGIPRSTTNGQSYFSQANCGGAEYVNKGDYETGSRPYGTGLACIDLGTTYPLTPVTQKNTAGGNNCQNYPGGGFTSLYRITAPSGTETTYSQDYELR